MSRSQKTIDTHSCVYLGKKCPLLRMFPWDFFLEIMSICKVRLTLPGRKIFLLMREINSFNHDATEGGIVAKAKEKNCPSSEICSNIVWPFLSSRRAYPPVNIILILTMFYTHPLFIGLLFLLLIVIISLSNTGPKLENMSNIYVLLSR